MKHLLLDLDGTLTDPREGIVRCFQHAMRAVGREPPDAPGLERFIGPPLGATFRTLLATTDPEIVGRAIAAYRERFASEGLFENRIHPEIPAALRKLRHAGLTLHVVTIKPRVFAERILDHFGLSTHMQGLDAPELSELLPSKTALVAAAISRQDLDRAEACMVGDRAEDVLAARNNGIRSIAVTWGYGSRAELTDAGPDLMVDSVGELLAYAGAAN